MADATLEARLEALWPDVVRPLRGLYGDRPDFDALLARLRTQVSDAYAARSPELRALDERRLVTPDWFQRTDVLGYVCYTDRFAGRLTAACLRARRSAPPRRTPPGSRPPRRARS